MPIFFKAPPQPKPSQLQGVLERALATDKIDDQKERTRTAQQFLQQIPTQQPAAPIVWWRVMFAFAVLIILFCGSIWLSKEPSCAKASETLLHCFELLFTATLGLFGIEAARHG
jgi:hypothetical protein